MICGINFLLVHMSSSFVTDIADSEFASKILESQKLALIDFWAPWCGPCRQLGPIVEAVAEELGDKVNICKMNIDENPETASQFGIRSIPALILFKDGKKVDMKVGSMPKNNLKEWIESHQ